MAKGKAVVIGPVPLEQPIEYRVSRVDGLTYTRTWIGPYFAIERVRLIEQRYAESMEVRSKGAVYTLVGRYAQSEPGKAEIPTETQELDTEIAQQSIFLNPKFQVLLPQEQQIVQAVFDTQRDTVVSDPPAIAGDYASPYLAGVARIQNATDASRWSLAIAAYDLLLMGSQSWENYSFVLNRTRSASRRYSGKINLSNIGKVCTTADLVKYTGNALLFTTPDLTLTTAETSKNLMAGWRLRVCRVSDTANGSRQMIEQWLLGKHSLDLYDSYVP